MDYHIELYDFYRRVFLEKFDLKFHKPKKDMCDTCGGFKNLQKTGDVDGNARDGHELHRASIIYTRNLKEIMKQAAIADPNSVTTAAFDLQKVLLTPYGKTSSFYYSMRMKNHNFTVTKINSMDSFCYIWSEDQGYKGACEIATALYFFL